MNREIRFRALLEDRKTKERHWESYRPLDQPFWLDEYEYRVIVSNSQFIGLKDKNGKDIYEGDILKSDELTICIKYKASAFVGEYIQNVDNPDLQNMNYLQWTVVGNIYESQI